jgi:hypothetical protein
MSNLGYRDPVITHEPNDALGVRFLNAGLIEKIGTPVSQESARTDSSSFSPPTLAHTAMK